VTLKTESSLNTYGETATSTDGTYWCRFLDDRIEVFEENERKSYYDKKVMLEPEASPSLRDIINDGTRDYYITACYPSYNYRNELHHWELAIR
jgi:hypothetical protein